MNASARYTLVVAAFTLASSALAQTMPATPAGRPPYQDPAQPVQKRVQDLVSRLTLEQKAQLLDHVAPDLVRGAGAAGIGGNHFQSYHSASRAWHLAAKCFGGRVKCQP